MPLSFGAAMSIAVSVRILPSRSLLLASCLMLFMTTAATAYGVFELPLNTLWQSGLTAVLCCLMAARFLVFLKRRSTFNLDIAASGRMVLRKFSHDQDDTSAMVVRLDSHSTLWPHLMMLHLRSEQGVLQIVPILRDSVDVPAWRALSVALRWLAVHERNQKNTSVTIGNF
ncbi:hypothetical protein LPB67_07650 [Undibacterium sp. Jales W-56]|uniref:protein YgfX n=1 Tax=Undibacterium sp. Jales W-56 TaxID=2897325 RepID=UPI0021CF5C77|nr:protein YgfX [Undibacterium sp. Jales W-56]MCU6433651.1 hypothetical protein [Undibacterium sp. Jales W-56]